MKLGYHLKRFKKGTIGEFSKVEEEWAELKDARHQKCKLMELVEISDMLGAIDLYLQKQYNLNINDALLMSKITQRAFRNGHRK